MSLPLTLALLAFAAAVVGVVWVIRLGQSMGQRQLAALREAATAHGWRLAVPKEGTGFELSGEGPGAVRWTLREDPSSDEADSTAPAIRWSTDAVRIPSLVLMVMGRRQQERLSGSIGLAMADRFLRSSGWAAGGLPAKALAEAGHEHRFGDAELRRRFVAITTEDAVARAVLSRKVEQLLQSWKGENLGIFLGGPDLRIQLSFQALDRLTIGQLVGLGLALSAGCSALPR